MKLAKRLLAAFLAALMLLGAGMAAAAADGEDITAAFPDANFRAYLLASFDANGDGKIQEGEVAGVTEVECGGRNIASLAGIEYFTGLEYLGCSGNQLTSLDVSKNTALVWLVCYYNQLNSLDISKNTKLEYLICDNNQLTALDVSKNTALEYLNCDGNKLAALDVSKNTALTNLYCDSNNLTTLDVSKNVALMSLWCNYNYMKSEADVKGINDVRARGGEAVFNPQRTPIKYIPGTTYKSTFGNWLLFIFCFGWIWMKQR